MKRDFETIKEERKVIFEVIDASWELAMKKGLHPSENGCNCITCVNKRKRLINVRAKTWNYNI